MQLKETWYEKLHRWEYALSAYEKKQEREPDNIECIFGQMRCLQSLGEWEKLADLSANLWSRSNDDVKMYIAPLACRASWALRDWENMATYVAATQENSDEGAFFRAALAIHDNDFALAQQYIDRVRSMLDTELTALVGESYSRAYKVIVTAQQLAEMEEIIEFNSSPIMNQDRKRLAKVWNKRLCGCQRDVDVWMSILSTRSLIHGGAEHDLDTWLKFCVLCRKGGYLNRSLKILTALGAVPSDSPDACSSSTILGLVNDPAVTGSNPKVKYAYIKHMWDAGNRESAIELLKELRSTLQQSIPQISPEPLMPSSLSTTPLGNAHQSPIPVSTNINDFHASTHTEDIQLQVRCCLKLGEWQLTLYEEDNSLSSQVIDQVLSYLRNATDLNPNSYKAWHAWAVTNFRAVSYFQNRAKTAIGSQSASSNSLASALHTTMVNHVVPAVEGFFESIALGRDRNSSEVLQDILRLLTLWFAHGARPQVEEALTNGFHKVPIDTWLQVIPQLIARVHSPVVPIQRLIHNLLSRLGKEHPQAVIYALTVASKSQSESRRSAAMSIMQTVAEHYPLLVQQAQLVCKELIRVAILWSEMWHEALEEASRLWFSDRNIDAMLATLEPLHEMMAKGPVTKKESAFQQVCLFSDNIVINFISFSLFFSFFFLSSFSRKCFYIFLICFNVLQYKIYLPLAVMYIYSPCLSSYVFIVCQNH